MGREDEGGGSGTGPRRYASSCVLTSFSLCGLVVVPSFRVLLVVLSSLALWCHVAAGDMAPGFGWASIRVRSVVSRWSRWLCRSVGVVVWWGSWCVVATWGSWCVVVTWSSCGRCGLSW